MQKYFTKEISQSLKVIVLGLAIGLGVSFVSANWTAPVDGPAPACNAGNPGCDAPINVSTTEQSKGGPKIPGIMHNVYGTASADNLLGFMGLTVGSAGNMITEGATKVYSTLNVDKSAYPDTATDARGRNLINLVGSAAGGNSVGVIQNKPNFFFWDYSNNRRANIQAYSADLDGTLRVGSGGPAAGKILAATGTSGLASWTTPTATVNITAPTPDIIMVEESWADINDNQSRSLWCPDNYAAIAVTCDSSGDGGTDTCYIMDNGNAYDYNGRQTGPDTGLQASFQDDQGVIDYSYQGGKISPANNNSNIHMWLTCMRYKNFPPISYPVTFTMNAGGTTTGTTTGTQGSGWNTIGSGGLQQGQVGQSCLAWVQSLYPAHNIVANDLRVWYNNGYQVGQCAYRPTNANGTNGVFPATNTFPNTNTVPRYPTSDFSLQVNL